MYGWCSAGDAINVGIRASWARGDRVDNERLGSPSRKRDPDRQIKLPGSSGFAPASGASFQAMIAASGRAIQTFFPPTMVMIALPFSGQP
jgi:hypothetical protein